MGETKFTKGPWHVGGDGIEGLWVSPRDTSINVICDVVHRQSGAPSDEDEANARLIAAAPALYDALKFKMNSNHLRGCKCNNCEAANAALALAEGKQS